MRLLRLEESSQRTAFPRSSQGAWSSTSTCTGLGGLPHLIPQVRGKLPVNLLGQVVVAAVEELRPDDFLLGKAENTEAAALQGAVKDVARVGDQVLALEDPALMG